MSDFEMKDLLPLLLADTFENDDFDDEGFEYHDDDDDDEMFGDEYDDDDDEMFGDEYDDDDDDEMFGDMMEGDPEYRRRFRRRRIATRRARYRRVRRAVRRAKATGTRSVVMRAPNGRSVPVKLSTKFAKASELKAALAEFRKAQKIASDERLTNHKRLAAQVSRNAKATENQVKRMRKTVDGLKSSAQTAQLMSLITEPPKLTGFQRDGKPVTVTNPTYTTPDMMLPLLLSSMSGGGGDNSAMMALAFSQMSKN